MTNINHNTPSLKGHEISFSREAAYENLCRAAVEYESPSNLLKFSSKTNQISNTGATTMNSSKKMENNENETNADNTSMYLRSPQDKTMTGGNACDNEFAYSGVKALNRVSPFIQK